MNRLGREDETLILHGKLSQTRKKEGRGGEVAASARVEVSYSKSGDMRPVDTKETGRGCNVMAASNARSLAW